MIIELLGKEEVCVVGLPFDVLCRTRRAGHKIVSLKKKNWHLTDEFWNAIKGKCPIMNVRNREYIKFRYIDMPRRDYFIRYVLRERKPIAYAVGEK